MRDVQTIVYVIRAKYDQRFLYLSERHPLERHVYERLKKRGYDLSKIPARHIEEEKA